MTYPAMPREFGTRLAPLRERWDTLENWHPYQPNWRAAVDFWYDSCEAYLMNEGNILSQGGAQWDNRRRS